MKSSYEIELTEEDDAIAEAFPPLWILPSI